MATATCCSNCGKSGAKNRCQPCKGDATRSVYYCNGTCQKAHWKTHKEVCLSIESNRELKGKGPRKEIKDMLLKSRTCLTCTKQTQKGKKTCSRCGSAVYCSRECQRKDWPRHKVKCEAIVNTEKTQISEKNMTNQFTMLKEWKELSTYSYMLMLHETFTKAQFKQQPPKWILMVELDFNWNFRTFLPIEEPYAMPIEMLPDNLKPPVLTTVDQLMAQDMPSDTLGHILLLLYKEIPSIKPLAAPTRIPRDKGQLDMVMKANTVDIPVLPRRLWYGQLGSNFKLQEQHFKRLAGENFSEFIFNALQLRTTKPLHKTHCIVIYFKFGFGLGEIADLASFELMTLPKARELVSQKSKTPEEQQTLLRDILDVENSPRLLASRLMYPNNILLPVLFVHREVSFLFASPQLSESGPNAISLSAKASAKVAATCFKKLREITKDLPDVESPELN